MIKKNKITLTVIAIISIALAIAFVLIYIQNIQLKNQINDLNMEYERGVSEGVNDFTLLIIDKLETCKPVVLMASQTSATVIDISCGVT